MDGEVQRHAASIKALEQRLARIEALLELDAPPTPPPTPASPLQPPPPPTSAPPPSAPPTAPSPPRATTFKTPPSVPAIKREAMERLRTDGKKKTGVAALNAEQLIGGRWFAAIGALVVILGVTLGVKYAWDQGWLGLVHPVVKVLSGVGFGVALLVAGEISLRKVGAWASAGLSAAGIGAIYASGYAAHVRFDLIGTPLAFLVLFATAALGIGVAVRARLASVAVLSLIGGYLAPVLLSTGEPHPYFFSTYLVVLLASALSLSAWQGRVHKPFYVMRVLGWVGTGFLGLVWIAGEGHLYPAASIPFIAMVWALVHAERFVASRGIFASDQGDAEEKSIRGDLDRAPIGSGELRPWGAAAASLSATLWAVSLMVLVLERWGQIDSWLAPGAFAAASLVLASVFAGHLRIIRDLPRTDAERVGAALLLQSGALLIVALAMALQAWALVLASLALGLASIACGRWIGAKALDAYGLVLLTLGTARVAALAATSTPWTGGIDLAGLYVTEWTGRLALTGAAWIGAAVLMLIGNPSALAVRSRLSILIGTALIMLPIGHTSSEAISVIVTWLAIIAGLIALDRFVPRLWGRAGALIATAVTLAYTLVRFPPMEWAQSAAPLGAHPALWLSAAIGAMALVVARFGRWDRDDPEMRPALWSGVCAIATLLMLGVTSLEVARGAEVLATDETVRSAALSIYWGLFGAGLLGAGFWRRIAASRYAGLGLIGLATLKAVAIDLQFVSPAWRVVSFLALGLLMLGVAVVYGKVSAALDGRDEAPATAPPSRL